MKLYMHTMSTTSRTVMLSGRQRNQARAADRRSVFGRALQGAVRLHQQSRMVHVLEDDGFCVIENSAILKYIAEKVGSPAYPKDLQKRARVNERMDWFNSNLYRDYGYGLVYPQILPTHKRPSDAIQAVTIAWHKERTPS